MTKMGLLFLLFDDNFAGPNSCMQRAWPIRNYPFISAPNLWVLPSNVMQGLYADRIYVRVTRIIIGTCPRGTRASGTSRTLVSIP